MIRNIISPLVKEPPKGSAEACLPALHLALHLAELAATTRDARVGRALIQAALNAWQQGRAA